MTVDRDNVSYLDDEATGSAPLGAHAEPPAQAARAYAEPEPPVTPAHAPGEASDAAAPFPGNQAPTPAHAAPGSFEPEEQPGPASTTTEQHVADLGSEPEAFAHTADQLAQPQADDPVEAAAFANHAESEPAAEHPAAHGGLPAFLADSAVEEAPGHAPSPATGHIDAIPDPTAPISPEDTAEIDIKAVEAKLNDPGSTQSFQPITDDLIDTDETFDAGTSSMLMWGARSDVGCVRSHNEDSYLVASPLFCVCDGMGGHAAGEVASSIAVETIAKTGPKTADAAQLGAAVEAANAAIIEAAMNGVGRPGMGCTATAAVIDGTTLAIAHVGDSRAYLLHEGTLIRVTRDHSYVEELVDAGEITADEARVHPNRSVITRALGSDPAMYADHFTLNIEEGDRLILCSDGLSSMIPDGEIERVAQQSSTAQICTDNLVDAALAAGGGDNVTVVVVDITDDGRVRQLARKHRRITLLSLVGLLAAILITAALSFVSVTRSVYLGVKDDSVAVYTGVPGAPFGLSLHWLEDETSINLEDLPEDTQNRLREGIPQKSLDDAAKAIENYRAQIDESKTKALADARAISGDREDRNEDGGELPPSATASAQGPADALGSSDPANPVAPSDSPAEGGAAR